MHDLLVSENFLLEFYGLVVFNLCHPWYTAPMDRPAYLNIYQPELCIIDDNYL